jgi:hypothetical protein
MRKEPFLRILFFVIFSCLGIAAISLSMLAQEWIDLYTINSKLHKVEQTNRKIEVLNRDHQSLIDSINNDPNMLKRLDTIVLGTASAEANIPVPDITEQQLQKVKAILAETDSEEPPETGPPRWLQRCGQRRYRLIMFIAGAGLILVSFTCFGKFKTKSPD